MNKNKIILSYNSNKNVVSNVSWFMGRINLEMIKVDLYRKVLLFWGRYDFNFGGSYGVVSTSIILLLCNYEMLIWFFWGVIWIVILIFRL